MNNEGGELLSKRETLTLSEQRFVAQAEMKSAFETALRLGYNNDSLLAYLQVKTGEYIGQNNYTGADRALLLADDLIGYIPDEQKRIKSRVKLAESYGLLPKDIGEMRREGQLKLAEMSITQLSIEDEQVRKIAQSCLTVEVAGGYAKMGRDKKAAEMVTEVLGRQTNTSDEGLDEIAWSLLGTGRDKEAAQLIKRITKSSLFDLLIKTIALKGKKELVEEIVHEKKLSKKQKVDIAKDLATGGVAGPAEELLYSKGIDEGSRHSLLWGLGAGGFTDFIYNFALKEKSKWVAAVVARKLANAGDVRALNFAQEYSSKELSDIGVLLISKNKFGEMVDFIENHPEIKNLHQFEFVDTLTQTYINTESEGNRQAEIDQLLTIARSCPDITQRAFSLIAVAKNASTKGINIDVRQIIGEVVQDLEQLRGEQFPELLLKLADLSLEVDKKQAQVFTRQALILVQEPKDEKELVLLSQVMLILHQANTPEMDSYTQTAGEISEIGRTIKNKGDLLVHDEVICQVVIATARVGERDLALEFNKRIFNHELYLQTLPQIIGFAPRETVIEMVNKIGSFNTESFTPAVRILMAKYKSQAVLELKYDYPKNALRASVELIKAGYVDAAAQLTKEIDLKDLKVVATEFAQVRAFDKILPLVQRVSERPDLVCEIIESLVNLGQADRAARLTAFIDEPRRVYGKEGMVALRLDRAKKCVDRYLAIGEQLDRQKGEFVLAGDLIDKYTQSGKLPPEEILDALVMMQVDPIIMKKLWEISLITDEEKYQVRQSLQTPRQHSRSSLAGEYLKRLQKLKDQRLKKFQRRYCADSGVSLARRYTDVLDPHTLKFLETSDIDWGRLASKWEMACPDVAFTQIVSINNIQILERNKPGIVNELSRQWGVADFGRYPVQLLLDMADSASLASSKTGALLISRSDHNGAFQYNEFFLPIYEFYNQMKKKGFRMVVLEAGSKKEVVAQLARFDRIVNGSRKEKIGEGQFIRKRDRQMEFLVIGAHGYKDYLNFFEKMTQADLKHIMADKVSGVFRQRMPTAFISCFAGVTGGNAEGFSDRFEAVTVGSSIATTAKRLWPVFDQDKRLIRIGVDYADTEAVQFAGGKVVTT